MGESVLETLRQRANTVEKGMRGAWLSAISDLDRFELRTEADLYAALSDDADATKQAAVCWALGNLKDERAVDGLVRLMERSDEVAFEAANALIRIGSSQAVKSLVTLLRSTEPPLRRAAAAYALGYLGDGSGNVLKERLDDRRESASLRARCAEALGVMRWRSALESLMSTTDDPSPEVRFWSIYALGELGDPVARSTIATRLHDAEEVETFGSIGAEAARVLEWLDTHSTPV